MEADRIARTAAVVLAIAGALGLGGIREAHALVAGPTEGADVHFVLGSGTNVGEIRVDLRSPVRTLSVRLDRGPWIPCSVRGKGYEATCRVPPGQGDAASISRVALAATR